MEDKNKPQRKGKFADKVFTLGDLVDKLEEKEDGGTFKNYHDNVIVIDKCPGGE